MVVFGIGWQIAAKEGGMARSRRSQALLDTIGMFEAGEAHGEKAKQRKYAERLEIAAGEILQSGNTDPAQILKIAADNRVNPMDILKVAQDFNAFRHRKKKMSQFDIDAGRKKMLFDQGQDDRTHRLGRRGVTEGRADLLFDQGQDDRTHRLGKQEDRAGFIDDFVQSLTGSGEFSPANPTMSMHAPNVGSSPQDIVKKMVAGGTKAGLGLPQISAMGETLGLPKAPGQEDKTLTEMHKVNPDGSVVHQKFKTANVKGAREAGWKLGKYTAPKAEKTPGGITPTKADLNLKKPYTNFAAKRANAYFKRGGISKADAKFEAERDKQLLKEIPKKGTFVNWESEWQLARANVKALLERGANKAALIAILGEVHGYNDKDLQKIFDDVNIPTLAMIKEIQHLVDMGIPASAAVRRVMEKPVSFNGGRKVRAKVPKGD